jgi:Predicted hydrolase (metallo-beta-lactamase superfamily)
MAGKKRIKRLLIALPAIILFILFANLCDAGVFPQWLQKPVDAVNNASGGLLYGRMQNTSGLTVRFLDVGQGDSSLVLCEGHAMLIDGGIPEMGPTVEEALRANGVKRLDCIIATHPHSDHIGGLVDVIKDYNFGKIIMTDATTTTVEYKNLLAAISDKKKKITRAAVGAVYGLGGAKFVILGPVRQYDDLNDTSIVIRLTYKKVSFLLTGDASEASEADMLAQKRTLAADVLKVGHHGSDTATTQAFLDAVHPRYAVISVGTGNSYGLPDTSVTQRLEKAGVKTFRTDLCGTVTFESDGESITCEKEKR